MVEVMKAKAVVPYGEASRTLKTVEEFNAITYLDYGDFSGVVDFLSKATFALVSTTTTLLFILQGYESTCTAR